MKFVNDTDLAKKIEERKKQVEQKEEKENGHD